MLLQPQQCIKRIGLTSLLIMLCGCNAAVKQANVAQATSNSTHKAALNPSIENAFQKGLEAIQNNDRDRAIDIFYAISRANPDLSGAYANLGMLLLDKKDYANAETALRQALRLNPDNPEVYNNLGLLYRHNGRFDDALQMYRQGLEQNPENSHLLRNTGILLDLYLDTPTEALEYYQRYLAQQPNNRQVQLWIADLNQRIMP